MTPTLRWKTGLRVGVVTLIAVCGLCAAVSAEDAAGAVAYARGLDALEGGEWNKAVSEFGTALDEDEDNVEYVVARGVALMLAERFEDARKDLLRAQRLKPDDFDTRLWLAASYFMSNDPQKASLLFNHGKQETHEYAETVHVMARNYMDSRYRGGYYDREARRRAQTTEPVRTGFRAAATAFVRRHRAGPSAGSTTLATAEQALKAGKYDDARRALALLRTAAPGDMKLLTLHAHAALGTGDALTARQEYTEVLTADPQAAAAYLGRARAAALLGDVAHAKSNFENAKKLDGALAEAASGDPALKAALAGSPPAGEQVETRLAALRAAAKNEAGNADLAAAAVELARASQANRLRADETYQEKLAELLVATRVVPPTAESLTNLGEFLYREATRMRGESVEPRAESHTYRPATKESLAAEMNRAEQTIDAALKLEPENVRALAYKAGCLMWRVKWNEAEAVLKKAVAKRPDSPELLELFSQLLDHAASVKSAKAANLRETKTWSDLSYVYWRTPSESELKQADVFDRQAEELWELSRQYFEAAAKAAAGTPRGFYYEGVIARRQKDPRAAQAAFEKAVSLDGTQIEARDQLSTVYSELGMTAPAHEQQAAAANLVHTTAGPSLRLAWLETARTARKAARNAAEKGWSFDKIDPRCAAYLGVIEEDAGKHDEAIVQFRIALALLEAQAREHGQSIDPGGNGSIRDDELGATLAVLSRLAAAHRAAGKPDAAMETCRWMLGLRPRVGDEQLRRPVVYGMLPDPAGDPTRIPEAEPPIAYFAQAHIELGRTALAQHQLGEAETNFAAVRKLVAEWPMTLPGRERLAVWSSWSRVGLVRVLQEQGKTNEALRLLRQDGFPGGLPDELRTEISTLQRELTQRRR